MLLGDQRGHALEPLVAKFRYPPADRAQQMLVMRGVASRLEALEAFPEVTLHDQTAASQYFDGAVYRRESGSRAAAPQFSRDVVGG